MQLSVQKIIALMDHSIDFDTYKTIDEIIDFAVDL